MKHTLYVEAIFCWGVYL